MDKKSLLEITKRVRKNIITMLCEAKSGHPGGSLSIADIMTYLFMEKIKRTKENALAPDRDRVVLSKGHGVPAMYAVVAEGGIL